MTVRIQIGDALARLRALPDGLADCAVTSPPYYRQRDYEADGQMGQEESPEAFVTQLVEVLAEVGRVLRPDGTLWLNLADSYGEGRQRKQMLGLPWRVAFALQADGWLLRQDIIWAKPNAMPSSVRDRCVSAHEYLFLLARRPDYYFDHEAIKTEARTRYRSQWTDNPERDKQRGHSRRHSGFNGRYAEKIRAEGQPTKAARRSVWQIATRPFKQAHFATFPPDLVEPCVMAGSRPGGTVLDPFGGAGTTGLVADRLGRHATLIELNADYAQIATERLRAAGVQCESEAQAIEPSLGPLMDGLE